MAIIRINDINDDRVELFTKYNEAQLYHYFEPKGGAFIAETPEVIKRALDRGAEPLAFLVEEKAFESDVVQSLLRDYLEEIDVFIAQLNVINKITGFNLTRGVLAACKRP